jgi:hypothetical protein
MEKRRSITVCIRSKLGYSWIRGDNQAASGNPVPGLRKEDPMPRTISQFIDFRRSRGFIQICSSQVATSPLWTWTKLVNHRRRFPAARTVSTFLLLAPTSQCTTSTGMVASGAPPKQLGTTWVGCSTVRRRRFPGAARTASTFLLSAPTTRCNTSIGMAASGALPNSLGRPGRCLMSRRLRPQSLSRKLARILTGDSDRSQTSGHCHTLGR